MSRDADEGHDITLRVARCDGPNISVMRITSVEDHIGNNIADRYVDAATGWRQLAMHFKQERNQWKNCADKLHALTVWDHIKQWVHDVWWQV